MSSIDLAPLATAADLDQFQIWGQKNAPTANPRRLPASVILNLLAASALGMKPFATIAARNADITSPAGTLAYVYANNGSTSDAANGFYQWPGSTAWVAAPWFAATVSASVQSIIDSGITSINSALAQVSNALSLNLAIGGGADPVTVTLGSTTPDSSNTASEAWSSGFVIEAGSLTESISCRSSAAMVADCLLVEAGTRKVVQKVSKSFGTGVSTVANPFASYITKVPVTLWVMRTSGGFLRTGTTSDSVIRVPAGTYNVGDTLPVFTQISGASVAIEVQVSTSASSLETRVARIDRGGIDHAVLAAFGDTAKLVSPSITLTAAGASSPDSRCAVKVVGRGIVNTVNIEVTGPSRGVLELWLEVDGKPTLMDCRAANLVTGPNPVAVPGWVIQGVGYIAYAAISGVNVAYATGGFFYDTVQSNYAIGATAAFTFQTGFSVLIQPITEAPSGAADFDTNKGPARLDYQSFPGTATPGKWSLTAPITVNNGLILSGAGGWDKFAGHEDFSSIHKRTMSARIKITDTGSVIAMGCKSISTASGIGGAVVVIDGVLGRLRIESWDGSARGTMAAETNFAAALVAGRKYALTVDINAFAITARLTDCLSGVETVTTFAGSAAGVTARFHGRPGFLHISGNATVEWSNFSINAPRACRAIIYGDSNTEGAATTGQSWAHLLAASAGDILVSARSGESSIDGARRLWELGAVRAKMAIWAHGTNDTTLATWRINTGAFVDNCRATNTEPVLVRPLPQPGKAALMTAQDGDITAKYFGPVRSIDFLGSMSNAFDRLTWNATYNIGDNLHANNAGQVRMAAQAKLDLPELG